MRPPRVLSSLLTLGLFLGAALPASAQSTSPRPRTMAGVCGTTNWVCVAECIDADCVDRCLREGCEKALDTLKACTAKARCSPEDTQCAARTCGQTCERAFEPAPPSPEKEKKDPCEGAAASGTKVPEELVGTWILSAASLPDVPDGGPERIEAHPRSDYARSLRVTPSGCFVVRTKLDDPTLGRGNALEVRAWGTVEAGKVNDKPRLVLRTRDGQAVGPVCGRNRVLPLSKGRFKGGTFQYELEEKDTLVLTVPGATRQTFQFEREKVDAPEPPPKPGE